MEQKIYADMVTKLKKSGEDILYELDYDKCELLHMAIGIAGEAGELLDAIKKHTLYNKPLDMDNVIEELGDLEFYMEGCRQVLQLHRNEILRKNHEKLLSGKNARYKEGKYSNEQAQARADKQ